MRIAQPTQRARPPFRAAGPFGGGKSGLMLAKAGVRFPLGEEDVSAKIALWPSSNI
jgi:hypothetical protein